MVPQTAETESDIPQQKPRPDWTVLRAEGEACVGAVTGVWTQAIPARRGFYFEALLSNYRLHIISKHVLFSCKLHVRHALESFVQEEQFPCEGQIYYAHA